jgi:hypothetical protein
MSDSKPPDGQDNEAALRAEYGEVCSTFRTLTDIRFKLLAFLPIAAAVTTAFAGDSAAERFLIGLFGLVTTIGLATYNARNDQLYDELVGRAAHIERRLGLADGAFAHRPGPWLTLTLGTLKHRIDHRTGVGIIYAASFALWLYSLIASALEILRRLAAPPVGAQWPPDPWLQPIALLLTVAIVVTASRMIRSQRKARSSQMAGAAARAVAAAQGRRLDELAQDMKFVENCKLLSGIEAEAIGARVRFFADLNSDQLGFYVRTGTDREAASYLVALITDLPPRWVEDCASNRRGAVPT